MGEYWAAYSDGTRWCFRLTGGRVGRLESRPQGRGMNRVTEQCTPGHPCSRMGSVVRLILGSPAVLEASSVPLLRPIPPCWGQG